MTEATTLKENFIKSLDWDFINFIGDRFCKYSDTFSTKYELSVLFKAFVKSPRLDKIDTIYVYTYNITQDEYYDILTQGRRFGNDFTNDDDIIKKLIKKYNQFEQLYILEPGEQMDYDEYLRLDKQIKLFKEEMKKHIIAEGCKNGYLRFKKRV